LRNLARGNHRWSDIAQAAGLTTVALTRPMERLIGDLGLVERVMLPEHLGPSFETVCRVWVRLVGAVGSLPVRVW
jgi:hypothetical protein